MLQRLIFATLYISLISCTSAQIKTEKIKVGAERTEVYFPLIEGKNLGIVANQTSTIGNIHLVDSLVHAGMNIVKVFGPEHGFRGRAADGEKVENDLDSKTGIPIISLYGANRKPTQQSLEGIDIIIFDIQDVGTRFYTYISSMTYMMEACAEKGIDMMVLDRPNPNGHFVDGPVLEKEYSSFVGLHEIPVVHGMTIGEYALMVNGEGWLTTEEKCNLQVIEMENWNHNSKYNLPIAPSPNLPNQTAIMLYPSLCFFEGTIISIGRGTDFPFQVIGHPDFMIGSFIFKPEHKPGIANHPKYEGQSCFGLSLQNSSEEILYEGKLNLSWLLSMHEYFKDSGEFFTSYFDKLAGTDQLRVMIENGLSEQEIRKSWEEDLDEFKATRKKYLRYPDFE